MIAASDAATMKRSTAAAAITAMLSQLPPSKVGALRGRSGAREDAGGAEAVGKRSARWGNGHQAGRACARGRRYRGQDDGDGEGIGRVWVVAHAAPCPVAAGMRHRPTRMRVATERS